MYLCLRLYYIHTHIHICTIIFAFMFISAFLVIHLFMCLFTIIFIFVFNLHLHWSANSHWHSIQCRPPHPPRSLPSRLLWCRRRKQMVCRPAVHTITAPTQGVFMTVGTFLFTSIPFQCLAQTQQRGAHIWPIWGPCLLHGTGHNVGSFGAPAYCESK